MLGLWIYDLRTNMHFTLKTDPLKREDLNELVGCFFGQNRGEGAAPTGGSRHERRATWTEKRSPDGRWRAYDYKDLVARDKASLDILWLKDDSLSESDNLPSPEVIAQEVVEDLEAALEQFRLIATDLAAPVNEGALDGLILPTTRLRPSAVMDIFTRRLKYVGQG